jgi:hypothetical protein
LARKEITYGSDFDGYLIARDTNVEDVKRSALWIEAQSKSTLVTPSADGTFGPNEIEVFEDILKNIGGNEDINKKITRRVLLILESMPIGDKNIYEDICRQIVERYISEKITHHQLGLFLLNDIIRYYRTVCVDYEYKTVEVGKSWGIRNIKLIYSRKLMYFSGLLICAEMAQHSYKRKREICTSLMRKTPIERILHIFGRDALAPLSYYDNFLGHMNDPNARDELGSVNIDTRNNSELFTNLKNEGHHFTWALKSAFERHYEIGHPIYKAIMF